MRRGWRRWLRAWKLVLDKGASVVGGLRPTHRDTAAMDGVPGFG